MENSAEIKKMVKEKYSKIALQDRDYNSSTCCGATSNSEEVYNIMQDDYSDLQGYKKEGDLGLGCGLPTQFARIQKGDTVIDLGSGAGNDCFVARYEAGETGKVIGIDFTEAMIDKARLNAEKLGYNNVEFRFGDIEEMPVNNDVADVVVSNCVLNLVPNKKEVVAEIFRVLKPGGHFSISDIVLSGDLPEALRQDAEMYAGCVSGAIQKETYLSFIEQAGFENITIQKEKVILIPDDILSKYLNEKGVAEFKNGDFGIFSITVFASKPGGEKLKMIDSESIPTENNSCCEPGSGCC
ncbi:arsenite methyltransferase [Chondrinema litorale]|uniref:arsenite methyltransferase n=1 Tax=Chondrinema litorale TaxID=2994555 RepID=UPI002543489F|nr:arsenite methyltransferase [Chondrinema litorale]UZR94940.1 arsenite methyltransferase [Chondrinema litorale]